jgi:hypothetical protein
MVEKKTPKPMICTHHEYNDGAPERRANMPDYDRILSPQTTNLV